MKNSNEIASVATVVTARRARWILWVVTLTLTMVLTPAAAEEDYSDCYVAKEDQDDPLVCPLQMLNCPLVQPPTLVSFDGLLDTELTVVKRTVHCVPQISQFSENPRKHVKWASMKLRNYVSPVTFPDPYKPLQGPTLRVNKARLQDPSKIYDATSNPIVEEGSRLRLLLKNQLPNSTVSASECQPAYYSVCADNPTQFCTCKKKDGLCQPTVPLDWTCDRGKDKDGKDNPRPQCELAEVVQTTPNCFHGPEVTNLHYHGTHVSPQPHQDFVLLKLFSEFQFDPPPPTPEVVEADPTIAVGSYETNINPFPWNQSPGTHWYHPHKHGSTAVQLVNGMAGALLIQGEFDDFLYEQFDLGPNPSLDNLEKLERFEKVMVIQQIAENIGFFHPGGTRPAGFPPYPLINGQLIPTIEMRYGEVQRWRFISATTNSSIQSSITVKLDPEFFPGFEVKQIAQDGIQFHPINYDNQPLGNAVDGYEISPGNRVDLLVRAPDPPPDWQSMTFYVTRRVVDSDDPSLDSAIRRQNRRANMLSGLEDRSASLSVRDSHPESVSGALLRVHISGVQEPAQYLPTRWPDIPPFLKDLSTNKNTVKKRRWVAFSMTTNTAGKSTQTTLQNRFFIDGLQYQDECAGQTLGLGQAEEWRITNNSSPQHPYHIHTNPFQLLYRRWSANSRGDGIPLQTQVLEPPYPWFDVIALKPGTNKRRSLTRLLYRPDDYTGAMVIHCHFLGHEDRGMMTNVQILCPGQANSPGAISFGMPASNGLADDCLVPPLDAEPILQCPSIFVEELPEESLFR